MSNLNELKELISNLSLSERQELQNFLAAHVDDHDIANSIENARVTIQSTRKYLEGIGKIINSSI